MYEFLKKLGEFLKEIILFYYDNEATTSWNTTETMPGKKPHIRAAYDYVNKWVYASRIKLIYVPFAKNVANSLTKALNRYLFVN